jgi:hypothetical protein
MDLAREFQMAESSPSPRSPEALLVQALLVQAVEDASHTCYGQTAREWLVGDVCAMLCELLELDHARLCAWVAALPPTRDGWQAHGVPSALLPG